ncbi:unnamed protein product [Paramecium sonneborni]|uniref:Protein kinase domain-containing protein n=1 Tax=Paramecium sonneborni TaxID=65129 RepID=A0A8S1NA84_9CILI|nr:unnamed protein product [Paramecium sonneborni]
MIKTKNVVLVEKINNSDWPIFKCNEPSKTQFWNKKIDQRFETNQIVIRENLLRIGKNKQAPKKYAFLLLRSGLLMYQDTKIKGKIDLNLQILIKKIELINEEDHNKQNIVAIRIQKYENCHIYIWNPDNQTSTLNWYKKLAQFCVAQNFEGFYKIIETIDQGAFSSVFLISPLIPEESRNRKLAAKIYSKCLLQKISGKQMKDFVTNECQILKLAKSDYIVELLEVIQLEDVVILILEYIQGGTLSNLLKQNEIHELMSSEICLQIILGLKEIHRCGYVHRDIKLDNILIAQFNPIQIKIIDFGFAEKINKNELINKQGTPGYIAPELFDLAPYTESCEIFSLGILFYILLCGNFPFRSTNYEVLIERNKQCQIRLQLDEWKNISSSAQRMVQRMLEKDPIRRITFSELTILLELHISNLKSKGSHSRQNLNILTKSTNIRGITYEIIEKSPSKLAQAIKDYYDDDIGVDENSLNNYNLQNLQQSCKFYNNQKWVFQ